MKLPAGMTLPSSLAEVDAAFMTRLLRATGDIEPTNSVVHIEEFDVGMTAGYFSAIKRMRCTFRESTSASGSYVVKAWPHFENAPKDTIAEMFAREINGYLLEPDEFYPRPRVLLADYDATSDAWALIMEDASAFASQKLHEDELDLDEVLYLVPRLVDIAVAWEGCHEGEQGRRLDALNVGHWASPENLTTFKAIMPGGARLFDRLTMMADSSLIGTPPWDQALGPGFAELLTRKLDAFYSAMTPEHGATCTLSHGDLRGDNLFFCDRCPAYPDGWLTIDFQLLFRGPVPSDLAYLMNSGSVLPDVYEGENRDRVLRSFYKQFMAKTQRYPNYRYDQFEQEYAAMATVEFVYYVGFGANIWQSAINNEQPGRVELGDRGETEADLAPDELRKRMWWGKALRNFRATFRDFATYRHLTQLPSCTEGLGEWFELPDRLRVN